MESIERLTRLNAELEGLLHVLGRRDNESIRTLVNAKYDEFIDEFKNLKDYFDANPLVEQVQAIEAVDSELSHDEVKDQEAVSSEVEDETDAAVDAIERGEQKTDYECETESESNAPYVDEEEIVEVELGGFAVNKNTAEVAEETPFSESEPMSEPLGMAVEEPKADIRVDEMLTRRSAADLKRVFTLNDKFRFRRSLFNQDDAAFSEALERLAEYATFDEAKSYVTENFGWDLKNPEVECFMSIIEPHYAK